MKKIRIRIILIFIICLMVGLYLYGLFAEELPYTKNLFRTISVVCLCIAGLIRTAEPRSRRHNSLTFYEESYREVIGDSFTDKPEHRKKLLKALRFFNEQNYEKSLCLLRSLLPYCDSQNESYAVHLFAALSFTRSKLWEQAEQIYLRMIHIGLADSRVYSNLGNCQLNIGNQDEALRNFHYALEYDPENANAYNNIAQTYFEMHELDQAIPYAIKAVEIDPKLVAASSLLAIIYALQKNTEACEKYSHIAVVNGNSPENLKRAIEHYKAAQETASAENDISDNSHLD